MYHQIKFSSFLRPVVCSRVFEFITMLKVRDETLPRPSAHGMLADAARAGTGGVQAQVQAQQVKEVRLSHKARDHHSYLTPMQLMPTPMFKFGHSITFS